MQPFTQLRGVVAPLDRANVDTDQIIPKQFLKVVRRTGLGTGLFYGWRRLPDGRPDPSFPLNQPPFAHAKMLLARENFGCGSSREHAPWALLDFGIRAILAPSFADIFANNCAQNGMLALVLPTAQVEQLFQAVARRPGMELIIDLPARRLSDDAGWATEFAVDRYRQQRLIEGLDDIALTLRHEVDIRAFEARHTEA